ncbi:MAG: DNA-3-methyladenine glycosylase [Bacteroidales bacterium]|nr:DNA-3-methyladenine glycosylase [Bacteroidales bacterium]
MKNKILSEDFYKQDAVTVARKLIGKILCVETPDGIVKKRITETEAYYGTDDTACHAHKGRTKRTENMFRKGGITYIYLCYGMYDMLNVVTGDEDFPEAVLIRGTENYNGPGKLTKALHITRELNGIDLTKKEKIWIEDDGFKAEYQCGKRIGINYATEEYKNKDWRFIMKKASILKTALFLAITAALTLIAGACGPEDCFEKQSYTPSNIHNAAPGATPTVESDC